MTPDVPNVAGVPPLVYTGSITADEALADGDPVISPNAAPIWGIFDSSNNPVAIADTFIGIQYRSDSDIPKAPIESGSFTTYNKVALPFAGAVQFACGGSETNRKAFLAALEVAKQSLNLYSVVTPDATYLQANIKGYDYRRALNEGAYIVYATVQFEEVRFTSAQYKTVPMNPAGASVVNDGKVQPVTPTTSQESVLSQALTMFNQMIH